MDKKEKSAAENVKKCCCDESCDCGCNEGKTCSCGCGCGDGKACGCGCGCNEGKACSCGCCCHKKMVFKILAILIVFLAGMGFHALLQCGFRCPMNKPLPVQMAPVPTMPFPVFSDPHGGDVIIINTDSSAVDKFVGKLNCGCDKDCGCKKNDKCKKADKCKNDGECKKMKHKHGHHFDNS